jgi:DNA-binding NarL/FixJ family response regulator
VDDGRRPAQGAYARVGQRGKRSALRPCPSAFGPLADLSRRLYRATTRPHGRDDAHSRTVETPRKLAWLRVSAYGLGEREREVVDLVVHGASTKEISQTLYISEYTMQEHLWKVFDKVGVRGRHALVKSLFFDNLYPELFV